MRKFFHIVWLCLRLKAGVEKPFDANIEDLKKEEAEIRCGAV